MRYAIYEITEFNGHKREKRLPLTSANIEVEARNKLSTLELKHAEYNETVRLARIVQMVERTICRYEFLGSHEPITTKQ